MVQTSASGSSPKREATPVRVEVRGPSPNNPTNEENNSETRCLWRGCNAVFDGAELLYRHLCDEHVGRNSKNNLCLSCGWDTCQASYSKRDHITSHLRIHIPMKPFSCNVCGKSFKRSQDLKKHGRTHAASSTSDDKNSDDGKSSNAGLHPSALQDKTSSSMSLYPSMPRLISSSPKEETAATPSYRSHSSRDSASPASSLSPSQDASPRLFAPAYHASEHGGMRYSPVDSLYPPMPKSYAAAEDVNYARSFSGLDYDHSPRNFPPRSEGGWNSGIKRPRRMVDDFWEDVRRKKVAPVYDADMADRLNQILTPGCAQDPGLLDLFLGDSLFALGSPGVQESAPLSTMSDRSFASHAPSYDFNFGRGPAPQPSRSSSSNLADVNSWLLQLGMNMARPATQGPATGAPPSDLNAPTLDFSQSLNMLGLSSIPGMDSLGTEPYLYGNASNVPTQDPSRSSRSNEYVHPQLAVRDTTIQPTYRHVEPLTRAPVAALSMRRAPSISKEVPMEEDPVQESTPPARSIYPRLPGESRMSPMDDRSGNSSPVRWEPSLSLATRERHLNLVLNILLALNKRQRIDPQSGRITPLMSEARERPRPTFMPPPLRRAEGRERPLSKSVLYDLAPPRSPFRDAHPLSNTGMRPSRAAPPAPPVPPAPPAPSKEDRSPPRTGALPSIAQLLSDVDMN